MNKPFRVCLLLVLPSAYAKASADKIGKGQ